MFPLLSLILAVTLAISTAEFVLMIPWSEFEMKMSRSFGGAYKPEAVPKIAVTPAEREMQRMGQ